MADMDGLDLTHLAQLAQLTVSDAQRARLQEDLTRILHHIDLIESVSTEGIEPTVLGGGAGQPLRADEPHDCLAVTEALEQAPQADGDCFVVPPILDTDGTP